MSSRITTLLVAAIALLPLATHAQPAECFADHQCRELYGEGSTCFADQGKCSNRFMSGCLHQLKGAKYSKRHCNSDDMSQEHCQVSPFEYPEIRVHNQNWEVAIFFSWILQIALSELLDVPVTVGLGDDTLQSSFYNPDTVLPYSKAAYGWDALRKANELNGDCLQTEEDCAHVIPDVWLGQQKKYDLEYAQGHLDYLDGNGQVGKIGWYVPRYTAARHPFSITYMGLSSDRHQLARVFKRPTTWQDYCHEVSPSNCTEPDQVASRYPGLGEEELYFSGGGNFIGHFRATEENDCLAPGKNNTCTGHIVGAPCSWSTFLESQAYWNNIALLSSGGLINRAYTYGQMIQIWNAANATKSDVIMWWFEPDAVLEQFRNSDAEFTKVHLPSPSIACQEHRTTPEDRCDANPIIRLGDKEGSCDNQPHVTKKAIARSLRDTTLSQTDFEQSPAYSFIRNFNIDELQINIILAQFVARGQNGYAAREAVCGWIANNTDYLESLIPPNHPKVFNSRDDYKETVTIVAYTLASFALVYILISFAITVKKRKAAVFVYSQVQFIFVVLFGLVLVAIGAILHGIEPNDTICTLRVWLVSLGYTFELVPLIIKVTALNRLMSASRRMRRIKINLTQLYSSVLVLSGIVAVYLLVWTILDPSKATEVRRLEEDRITVSSHFGCRSESGYWNVFYLLWEGILILWCSVLAFQSRTAKAEFNESKSLGMMIYSHFMFSILRIIVSVVFENDVYTNSLANSYLLSFDIIMAITIYLVPKMVMPSETIREAQQRRGSAILSATANSIQESVDNKAKYTSSASQPPTLDKIEENSIDGEDEFEKSTSSSKDSGSGNFTTLKEYDGPPSILKNHNSSGSLGMSSDITIEEDSKTSSVHYWAGPGAPAPPAAPRRGSHSASPSLRRVKFRQDTDPNHLQQVIGQKDQELAQLKTTIQELQKKRDKQDARIARLLKAVDWEEKLSELENEKDT